MKTSTALLLPILKEAIYFGLFMLATTLFSADENDRIIYVAVFLLGRAVTLRIRVVLLEENSAISKTWLLLL